MMRYPPPWYSVSHKHICGDTPFCNISRDNCAIPHKNKHGRVLRYYRYNYRAIREVSLLGLSGNLHKGLLTQEAPEKAEISLSKKGSEQKGSREEPR